MLSIILLTRSAMSFPTPSLEAHLLRASQLGILFTILFTMPSTNKSLSHGDLKRDVRDGVEEIVVSKRHLCGEKVAAILPPHFTAMEESGGDFYHAHYITLLPYSPGFTVYISSTSTITAALGFQGLSLKSSITTS